MLSFQLEISKENMYIVNPEIPTPHRCRLSDGQSQDAQKCNGIKPFV
jgi:hypothetical protein